MNVISNALSTVKSVIYFVVALISITLTSSINANEISIEQEGQEGQIELGIANEAREVDLLVRQSGIENLLDASFGSNVGASIEQSGNFGSIKLETLLDKNSQYQINQIGDHNELNGIFSGNSNSAEIDQSGTSNLLTLDVGGESNKLIIDQGGANNRTSLSASGNASNFDVSQHGDNNNIDINSFSSNTSVSITQSGSGESITIDQ